jgi:hypothetical protein
MPLSSSLPVPSAPIGVFPEPAPYRPHDCIIDDSLIIRCELALHNLRVQVAELRKTMQGWRRATRRLGRLQD